MIQSLHFLLSLFFFLLIFVWYAGTQEKLVSAAASVNVVPMLMVQGFEQSDSNSEASAAESSVINNNCNMDCDQNIAKIRLPFIDFLGVGAT